MRSMYLRFYLKETGIQFFLRLLNNSDYTYTRNVNLEINFNRLKY